MAEIKCIIPDKLQEAAAREFRGVVVNAKVISKQGIPDKTILELATQQTSIAEFPYPYYFLGDERGIVKEMIRNHGKEIARSDTVFREVMAELKRLQGIIRSTMQPPDRVIYIANSELEMLLKVYADYAVFREDLR